jgi:hypothetical protein
MQSFSGPKRPDFRRFTLSGPTRLTQRLQIVVSRGPGAGPRPAFAFRVFSNRLRIGEKIQGPQLAGADAGRIRDPGPASGL